ncbi:MAG: pilin [Patescibacteria group bacterium]
MKVIKKYKKALVGIITSFIVFFGDLGIAQAADDCNPCEDVEPGTVCIPNPVRFCSINDFLTEITNLLIQLGLALVVFMVVLGAAYIMFGGADPQNITKGKNIIKWTVLGVFVVIFARAILAVIQFAIGG